MRTGIFITTAVAGTGSGGDDWGSQVVVSDASLTGDGTTAHPLKVAAGAGTVTSINGQTGTVTLKPVLSGNTIAHRA